MRKFSGLIAGAAAIALLGAFANAQAPHPNPVPQKTPQASPAASSADTHTLDRADLEPWLDGLLPDAMEQGDIAGGVVVVVKNGQVLLQKGYGYSDVHHKTPVNPEETLFRLGSVSKLFTWTAVMQLVQQGKIDLDRDVNDYLDFRIPPAFGKPITMRNLMTHTGGFEEIIKGIVAYKSASFPSLDQFLKEKMPRRIFPPGETPAYSNYGAGLAGYIVQRLSGEPFEEYVDHHIFQRLGMSHSTFKQPLPESFAPFMSKGYHEASDPPIPFELAGPVPAGGLTSTGADMARFMIAHLEMENAADGPLLNPQTARLMHDSIFTAIPPLNGMSLGFFLSDRNGHRIIGHGGDTQVFHSDLEMFMNDGVGLYASFNSTGKDRATYGVLTSLQEQFTDRYFPAPVPAEPTASTAIEHAQLIARAGPYQNTRRSISGFVQMFYLFSQENVSVNADGTISLASLTNLNGKPKIWHEISPYVWREVGGKLRLAARVADGKVQLLGAEPDAGAELLQPAPASRSITWNLPLLIGSVVVLLLTAIFWPVTALVRRRFGVQPLLSGREATVYRLTRITAVVDLLFLLGWVLIIQTAMSDLTLLSSPMDKWIRLVRLIGIVGVAGTAVAFWNAWINRRGPQRWWSKFWNVLLAISCLGIAWIALEFGLITASLKY